MHSRAKVISSFPENCFRVGMRGIVTSTRAKREDARFAYPWEIYHANCRALERRAAVSDRPLSDCPRELSRRIES